MNIFRVFFIALGLAMDAFAVSVASGTTIKQLKTSQAVKIALAFGLFQALMPVVGWLGGLLFREYLAALDHWVAFLLLFFIGCKMIYEGALTGDEKIKKDPLNLYVLLLLSIATSIDALAVGLSLSLLRVDLVFPVIVIGVVTLFLSFIGVFIGNRMGHLFENKLELLGGLILIGIGLKILTEHLA